MMQKYTSKWIDPTYVLVFTVYLGIAIFNFDVNLPENHQSPQNFKVHL